MSDLTITRTARHSVVAALAVLIVAFSGFETRAQDGQLALAPAYQTETQGTADAAALAGNDEAGWEDYYQSNLTALNLDLPGIAGPAADKTRVAQIASCYEASFGRYAPQGNAAPAGPTGTFDSFQSSMDRYNAQKNSQQNFETCAK